MGNFLTHVLSARGYDCACANKCWCWDIDECKILTGSEVMGNGSLPRSDSVGMSESFMIPCNMLNSGLKATSVRF